MFKKRKFNLDLQGGQSLAEILVVIGVGAILIGGAAGIMAPILKSNSETKNIQTATSLAQNYLDNLKNFSESNWLNIYNLSKGSGNKYMLVASSTQNLIVKGEEGVLDGDIVSGLVGNWKFDEFDGLTVYDFSGNQNNGLLISNPTRKTSSDCKVGGCLEFNGSNRADIDKTSTLSFTNSFSVSAWVKPTDCVHGSSGHNTVIAQEEGLILAFNNNCEVANYVNVNNIWVGPDGISQKVPVGEWSYLAMVWNGSNLYSYFNGKFISGSGTSAAGSWTNSVYDYYVGARPLCCDQTFNGLIDDIRIYNRVLSASEINQLYRGRNFVRSFFVENVNRNLCGAGNVTTDAATSCISGPGTSGVIDDPSTQKITASVSWAQGGLLSRVEYFTRNRNNIFSQIDWTGGLGQDGPITSENDKFSSSTRIDYSTTTGSIRIQGL
ncbi:MAG: LamG domain-containing protein [Candidatus Paceibacterota bacterium]